MTAYKRELYWGSPDGGRVHIFDNDVDARSLCGKWFDVTPAIQEPLDADDPRFSREEICGSCDMRMDWERGDGWIRRYGPPNPILEATSDVAYRWEISIQEAQEFLKAVGFIDQDEDDE